MEILGSSEVLGETVDSLTKKLLSLNVERLNLNVRLNELKKRPEYSDYGSNVCIVAEWDSKTLEQKIKICEESISECEKITYSQVSAAMNSHLIEIYQQRIKQLEQSNGEEGEPIAVSRARFHLNLVKSKREVMSKLKEVLDERKLAKVSK
jgi:hypothetical protein